jgi:phosphoserine aminotransferase
MTRVFNFSAGPAVLPLAVLEEAQQHLLEYPGAGMSVLEMSHRSKPFEAIIQSAEARIRDLLHIPDNYHVLFLQGGASLQFSMVPMNLLPAGASADYILTDQWSQKALKEAQKLATERGAQARVAASTESENFARIPTTEEIETDTNALYSHFTTNNTLFGTQWQSEPHTGSVPLVADASSDILSRPLNVEKYGLIYAGAQKNMGPGGVTLVVVRDDMLQNVPSGLATMLDYRTHAKTHSLYNTPNTWGVYIVDLVAKWLQGLGGLEAMQRLNEAKARELYDAIDATNFYQGHAHPGSRSRMNVTFRLPSEALEKEFIQTATQEGLDGLKGHRDVGGLRASVYNAFPPEGVSALVQFMREFERTHG